MYSFFSPAGITFIEGASDPYNEFGPSSVDDGSGLAGDQAAATGTRPPCPLRLVGAVVAGFTLGAMVARHGIRWMSA